MDVIMNKHLTSWRRQLKNGVARFPFGQPEDPVLTMLPPHLEAISVYSVVGSVDRYQHLDRRFRPSGQITHRLRAIAQAMKAGAHFPPIEVYRLDGACYVIDGHHRVAAALEVGQMYLDARVIECRPRTDEAENPLEEARVDFALRTGLRAVTFSEPRRYAQAFKQILEHRWYMNERGRTVSMQEAAEDWYQNIYLPVIRQIAAQRLARLSEPPAVGDLYLQLSDLKYKVSRERGHDIGFTQTIREWATRHRQPHAAGLLSRLLGARMLASA